MEKNIIALFQDGMSYPQIARELNGSLTFVIHVIEQFIEDSIGSIGSFK